MASNIGSGRVRATLRLITAFVALAVVIPPVPPPAHAGGSLRVEGAATWTLVAGQPAVQVSVEFTLTNLVPDVEDDDGVVTRTFFDTLRPTLPVDAANVSADADGAPLSVVTVTSDPPDGEGEPLISAVIALPQPLFYEQTQAITLRFDLPGSPPRSEGRVRVNPAYAAFDARAWGDPGLASVEIRVDEAYEVTTFGSEVRPGGGGGFSVFDASGIADPGRWFVHVSARNDAALDAVSVEVDDLDVTVLAWPDDPRWAEQMRALVEVGLPYLRGRIGLDYGDVDSVEILEARDPSLLGFAGWYLSDLDRIEMGELVDDHVVLHELTHLWFNHRLFVERWVNEGLAEVFAADAVVGIGGAPDPDHAVPYRPVPGDPARVPLNEWQFPDVAPGQDPRVRDRELYGYNASHWVMDAIAVDVGIEGLAAVARAASLGETAYAVDGTPTETADDRRTDWRRFLDLAEERAGSGVVERLVREHVVTADQRSLLDERASARAAYAELRSADPPPPWAVRRLMDAWDFAEAGKTMAAAAEILGIVGATDDLATAMDLTPPLAARFAYARAATMADLDAARLLADANLEAAVLLIEAVEEAEAPRGLLTRLGLLGADTDRRLAAARSAFERSDAHLAMREATAVLDALAGANDSGRVRAFWGSAALLVVLGAGVTWLVAARRRGKAR